MNQTLTAEAYMTKQQLITEIRKPGTVMVAVPMTDDDVMYVQAVKADLLHLLNESEQEQGWIADRDGNTLYVG